MRDSIQLNTANFVFEPIDPLFLTPCPVVSRSVVARHDSVKPSSVFYVNHLPVAAQRIPWERSLRNSGDSRLGLGSFLHVWPSMVT